MSPAETLHPSDLSLDIYRRDASAAPAGVAEHVASCPACRERLERAASSDSRFLESYPTLRDLSASVGTGAAGGAPRRRFLMVAGAGCAALAAAALVAFALLPSPRREATLAVESSRAKGGSVVEMVVKRDGTVEPFTGQRLRAGDVLAFRYTTSRRYLIAGSVEATSRTAALITSPDGARSLRIRPGRSVSLRSGIELDSYAGRELIVLVLSDDPISVPDFAAALSRLHGEGIDALPTGPASVELGLPGEAIAFSIDKESAK